MKERKLGSKILMILSWQGWVLLETKSQIGCRLLLPDCSFYYHFHHRRRHHCRRHRRRHNQPQRAKAGCYSGQLKRKGGENKGEL